MSIDIETRTRVVELHIAYDGDGDTYFLNRRENGRQKITAKPITEAEAGEIMAIEGEANVKVSRRAIGSGWSWIATVTSEVQS